MPELNDDDIRTLAKAVNLNIQDSDITDVKYSLSAMLEAIENINPEGINGIEPIPIIFERED